MGITYLCGKGSNLTNKLWKMLWNLKFQKTILRNGYHFIFLSFSIHRKIHFQKICLNFDGSYHNNPKLNMYLYKKSHNMKFRAPKLWLRYHIKIASFFLENWRFEKRKLVHDIRVSKISNSNSPNLLLWFFFLDQK